MSCDDEFLVFRKYVVMLVGVAAVDWAFLINIYTTPEAA
jgi:hypothetical protein